MSLDKEKCRDRWLRRIKGRRRARIYKAAVFVVCRPDPIGRSDVSPPHPHRFYNAV